MKLNFLERLTKFVNMAQQNVKYLTRSVSIKEIEFIIKRHPTKKKPSG